MTDEPVIYTAGKMDWVNGEDSYWRESIDIEIPNVEFLHPHESWFDHGGDYVKGAVAEDISMISRSDGVIALFTDKPQIGTLVEVLHAVENSTPVLAMFDIELLSGRDKEPQEIEPGLGPVPLRAMAPDHWFLINYLTGDSAGERPDVADKPQLPNWIRDWDGVDASVARVDASRNGDIRRIVENWVNNDFDIDTSEIGVDEAEIAKEVADPD